MVIAVIKARPKIPLTPLAIVAVRGLLAADNLVVVGDGGKRLSVGVVVVVGEWCVEVGVVVGETTGMENSLPLVVGNTLPVGNSILLVVGNSILLGVGNSILLVVRSPPVVSVSTIIVVLALKQKNWVTGGFRGMTFWPHIGAVASELHLC
jgi:hypothetical protein